MGGRAEATFGRRDELAHALRLVDDGVRLLSVTGRSGVGKTHFALDLVDSCALPAVVVPLSGVTDPDFVASEIAAALEVPALPGRDVLDLVVHRIGTSDLVLVLDNFEHVLAAASAVSELIDRCPNLRIVATSQALLQLKVERVLSLSPLPLPSAGGVDAHMDQPAVALYCERAGVVHPAFRFVDDNAAAVAELCRALEGLPLAIELAAARASTLSAADVLARLGELGLAVLRRPRGDAPPRHHDLRSAISWTYELLGEDERRLLRRIADIAGTFGLDDLHVLTPERARDDLIDELSALVDFHLVDPVPDKNGTRYGIPSSIRMFALEEARAIGEYDDIRTSHVRWRANQARELSSQMDAGGEVDALSALDVAHDDFVNVLHAALELEMVADALELVCALAPYWQFRGFHTAHEQLLDEVLRDADKHAVASAARAEALAWSACLGLRLRISSDSATLVGRLDQAEERARSLGNETAILRVLSFRMLTFPVTRDVEGATAAGVEGLERAATAGHEHWLARFEVWSGALAHQLGDDDRALGLSRAGLARGRQLGDMRTVVIATMIMRPMVANYPQLDAELLPLTEALDIARRLGLALYEAGLLSGLAIEAASHGDVTAAQQWCFEALMFVRGSADSPLVGFGLAAAIDVAVARGNFQMAAYLHGAIRDAGPVLRANSGREQQAAHNAALVRAKDALGAEDFDALTRRGNGVPWSQALEEAISFVRPEPTATGAREPAQEVGLTPRQVEVLRLLATGLRNKEIAEHLKLTPKTVMHHLTSVYRTLNVRGRSEATAWAHRAGIVK